MLVVGLTGGIGSGKSTVSAQFAQHGIPIIDTDLIARELVQPGSDNLTHIQTKLGNDYVTVSGELDRKKLRTRIFQDTAAKQWLENLLHPQIRDAVTQQLQNQQAAYAIVVIPLLLETDPACSTYSMLDRILVIDCAPEQQKQRALKRDDCSASLIDAILAQQVSREERLAAADDVIDNQGDIDVLRAQVDELHARYLAFTST